MLQKKYIPCLFIFYLVLCCFFIPVQSAADDARGLELLNQTISPEIEIGKKYLFLIAVSTYLKWPSLQYPRKDAESLIQILTQKYYIDEVITLYNTDATKVEIMKQFKTLQEKLKPEDSLLIYYAGHGFFDETTSTGFWIPSDAGIDENKQLNWIPNIQIQGFISNMKSRHIFLIADSCFSGDLLTSYRSKPHTITVDYYKDAYAKVSRQVITSGNILQQVPDKSEFSSALMYFLQKNAELYLTPLAIFEGILRYDIKNTNPLFGYIPSSGHEAGSSFILFKRPGNTGVITVSSKMAGTVFLSGNRLVEQLTPGEQISKEVVEGTYFLEIIYTDNKQETREIEIIQGEELFMEFTREGDEESDSLFQKSRFLISVSGAYSTPLYEYGDRFSPYFCGNVTEMYNLLSGKYSKLSLAVKILGIYHGKSDTVDYENSLFIMGIIAGTDFHISMPFYAPLELFFNGSLGYSISFFAHEDLPNKKVFLDDFMAGVEAGIGYSFHQFLFFLKSSYIIVFYENSAALHDVNAGIGVGIRF